MKTEKPFPELVMEASSHDRSFLCSAPALRAYLGLCTQRRHREANSGQQRCVDCAIRGSFLFEAMSLQLSVVVSVYPDSSRDRGGPSGDTVSAITQNAGLD